MDLSLHFPFLFRELGRRTRRLLHRNVCDPRCDVRRSRKVPSSAKPFVPLRRRYFDTVINIPNTAPTANKGFRPMP